MPILHDRAILRYGHAVCLAVICSYRPQANKSSMAIVIFWRAILFLSVLFDPCLARAQVTAEQALDNSRRLVSSRTCGSAAHGDEITVCGTGKSPYRLPLPPERPPVGQRVSGDVPRASSDVARSREFGVHRGQRQCSLHDLREFGYGGGSVPVRALVMLVKTIVDPDAELGPLGGYPVTREERE